MAWSWMGWWVCFPVGWSQALEFYARLAYGLDLAHTKLLDLVFPDPMVLFQNHIDYTIHCSSILLGVDWLTLLVGVLHYHDWLHWNKEHLLLLGSEHSHKVSAVQKGHGRPFVSFPPLYYKPHSVWVVLSACPCGCHKDDSWLPPGVYSLSWAHSPPAGTLRREQTRIPPRGPSQVLVNCAANWAVLGLRRNDQQWKEFHKAIRSKNKNQNLCININMYLRTYWKLWE